MPPRKKTKQNISNLVISLLDRQFTARIKTSEVTHEEN